jgi:hypothetical protein
MRIDEVLGVDFSGAKQAGRNIWIARAAVSRGGRPELIELTSLESLCGTCEREAALAALVAQVTESRNALWGMDFPFGLPIEVLDDGSAWPDQLDLVTAWPGDAATLGRHCLGRAKSLGGKWHIRRRTDTEAKTPFDCYHYRIIYQTFHGMRDVLAPLARTSGTAVLPFQYGRLRTARRLVVESCPGSTLKRWGAPHQNYKQPAGGPLSHRRRRTRHAILAELARHIDLSDGHRRAIMRNGGGDALDAVIAAAGAFESWRAADHAAIARHPRYPREGYLYA